MPKLRNIFSFFLSIIVGSFLYVILNLVPIAGPIAVGVVAGKFSGNDMKRGFFAGLFSGIVGFLLVFFVFYRWIYEWGIFGKLFIGLILIVWNFFAIVFAGIGGVIGAGFFKEKKKEKVNREERKTLVLCKKCKAANPKENKYCNSCGKRT